MKISKKYQKIAEAYRYFAKDFSGSADFSMNAQENMYSFETFGSPRIKYSEPDSTGMYNGYAIGKHWMDVTLAMWREDIHNGYLTKFEIINDDEIPNFVKNIVVNF